VSLDAPVEIWSTFESPDGDSVTIGDEEKIVVATGRMGAVAFKKAIEAAVIRAHASLKH
jgi:hypothetical protein